jgi:hypothetical protein
MSNPRASLVCRTGAILALSLTMVPHAAFAQRDPFVGLWQLNATKSTYSPGPPPKSQRLVYSMAGQTLKAINQGIDGEGKATKVEFTIVYDGHDYPSVGSPDYDSSAYTRVDPYNSTFVRKFAGQVVMIGTRSISKDGKMLTITTKGVNAQGRTVNNVSVWEKRQPVQ